MDMITVPSGKKVSREEFEQTMKSYFRNLQSLITEHSNKGNDEMAAKLLNEAKNLRAQTKDYGIKFDTDWIDWFSNIIR